MDTSPSDPNLAAICETLRGIESTNEVLSLLRQPTLIPQSDLIPNNSLSALSSCEQEITSSHAPTGTSHSGYGRGGRRSDNFSMSVNLKPRPKHSWTKMTDILIDDGYAWRKYGQKPIRNTKFPRSYYKCTYSPRCDALKQVQMIDDKPPLYKITYTCHHTCKNGARATTTYSSSSSIVIDFASKNIFEEKPHSTKSYKRPFSEHMWSSVKEEDLGSESQFSPQADYQLATSSLDHAANCQINEYLQMDEGHTSLDTVSDGFDESSFSVESFMNQFDESSFSVESFMNQYIYDVMPSLY